MSETATATPTLDDQIAALTSLVGNLARELAEVKGIEVPKAEAPAPAPKLTVIDGDSDVPIAEPKVTTRKVKTEGAAKPEFKLDDTPGSASFKQKKALSAVTAKTATGGRVVYLGGEGTKVREYWSFLSKLEASNAIDALKNGSEFTFSNGVTVQSRNG